MHLLKQRKIALRSDTLRRPVPDQGPARQLMHDLALAEDVVSGVFLLNWQGTIGLLGSLPRRSGRTRGLMEVAEV